MTKTPKAAPSIAFVLDEHKLTSFLFPLLLKQCVLLFIGLRMIKWRASPLPRVLTNRKTGQRLWNSQCAILNGCYTGLLGIPASSLSRRWPFLMPKLGQPELQVQSNLLNLEADQRHNNVHSSACTYNNNAEVLLFLMCKVNKESQLITFMVVILFLLINAQEHLPCAHSVLEICEEDLL